MPQYIAIYQVDFKADDFVSAINVADSLRGTIEEELELDEDGDTVDMIDLVEADSPVGQHAETKHLRQARNILLRTRTKEGYDAARSLDMAAFALEQKFSLDEDPIKYDYTKFMEVLQEVLNGNNPLDH